MSNYNLISDEDLFIEVTNGNSSAYTELYERYKKPLMVYASQKVSLEESEDLIHDLFSKIWTNRETLALSGNFSGYIFTSLRNRIIDYILHSKHINKYLESLESFSLQYYSNLPDYRIREKMFLEKIENLLVRYSPKVKQIVNLRMKGYTNQEIATIVGLSEKTVRNQYSGVLKNLRNKLTVLIFISFHV